MPKFLDAPSWYDSDGELREMSGYYNVGANYGTFCIPAFKEKTTAFPFGGTFYVSTTAPGSGQVCVSSSGNLIMTTGGTAGNVLIKAANGAPTWSGLYVHNVYIYGTGAGGVAAYAYMTVVSSDSEEYTTAAQVYAKFSGYQHTVMTTGKIASESTYGVIVASFLSNNDIGMRYIKIGTPNGGASSIYITPSSISDKVCSIT